MKKVRTIRIPILTVQSKAKAEQYVIKMQREGLKKRLRFVIGDGRNFIHPIHVKDLVANEKPITLGDFLNLIASYAGVKLRYGFPPKIAHLILKIKSGVGGSSAENTVSLFTRNFTV